MRTTTIMYTSRDGHSTIRALIWEADETATQQHRGVVQIVHGMSEHVERYAEFAERLVKAGFTVCANDHVGHGKSARDENELGHMPLHGGEDVLVEDVHALRTAVLERVGGGSAVPYVIFGHSMGSFVTRVDLTRYAFGVNAAVVCGTGQQPVALTCAGIALTSLIARVRGERHRSGLVDSMGAGGFSRAIPDARTPVDWISTDRAVVDEYLADPACGQLFTVGAYHTLSSLARDAQRAKLTARIPKGLPMLFIAGDQDPVGDFGRGVERAAGQYLRVGLEDVEVKLYQGYRHEILNEPCKQQVCEDVLEWLQGHGL